jgi:hypothetical protein
LPLGSSFAFFGALSGAAAIWKNESMRRCFTAPRALHPGGVSLLRQQHSSQKCAKHHTACPGQSV